jgi:hypothetical protein
MSALRNMRPSLALNQIPDGGPTNAIFGGKLTFQYATHRVSLPNMHNQFIGQFGVRLTNAAPLAALCNLIRHVVGLGSKKQMGRIHTRSIVALVTDKHPFGDGAMMEFVAHAVRNIILVAMAHMAVTARLCALPFPAFVWLSFGNIFPKGFLKGYRKSLVLMTVDEVVLLAGVTVAGNFLSATALAQDLGRGIMGLHKNLQFLCQAQDVSRVAGQLLLGATPVSIPQTGGIYQ